MLCKNQSINHWEMQQSTINRLFVLKSAIQLKFLPCPSVVNKWAEHSYVVCRNAGKLVFFEFTCSFFCVKRNQGT